MQDNLGTLDRPGHDRRVADVAPQELDPALDPAEVLCPPRREVIQDAHRLATRHEGVS